MKAIIRSVEDYKIAYKKSIENPDDFWAELASQFEWIEKWKKVYQWDFESPKFEWFVGGKLNITINCIDRHLSERADQVAILWEPNDPSADFKSYTYQELHDEVCRVANALKSNGIEKGDRVCFYMPMIPELAIGVLACARIGAVHSVVFAGFSASSLADRINDSQCKMVVCSDFNHRGSKLIPVKEVVDDALHLNCPSIETVLVFKNSQQSITWKEGIDKWWHSEIENQPTTCSAEPMDSEDMLFILYTSGSTGKPKGVVHTCGGYMVYTWYTFNNVFQYTPGDIYWCTADIGWITGHSYIVYGPLLSGATTVMFEGVPTYPDPSRFWQVCEKHKVNQFYTAPTAIRSLMGKGNKYVDNYSLGDLKVLGSVGEPINEEAWQWYFEKIGKKRVPIVDTWWQTETGGIMISPLPGVTDTKPCYASYPLPGIFPLLVDKDGNEIEENEKEGLLCIKYPWPSILRTTYGDHERYKQVYFSTFENLYFTGDGARRDSRGRLRIIGRVDDVINVSGHRLGTAELENAINEHENVIESAVVGYPHDIKGSGICVYAVCTNDHANHGELFDELKDLVSKIIGPIAKPDKLIIVNGLPKTRSGKIMRRILRKVAQGETKNLGDTSTLLNPEVVDEIIKKFG